MTFAIVACIGTDRGPGTPPEASGPLRHALAAVEPLPMRWGARLSLATSDASCGGATPAESVAAADACAVSPAPAVPTGVAAVVARAREALARGPDADALHTLALIDLAWADTSGKSLDRSVQYLEMVTRLAPSSASAFVDLSAARLARARQRDDARELLAALDAASRAVALQPRAAAAQFDRALALDRLGLGAEARKAWRAFLDTDSTSAWAAAARRRLSRTDADSAAAPTTPAVDAPAETLAAFAERSPGEARSFAWERLLGDWAAAESRGESAVATARLASASVVGTGLARGRGDASIMDVVRSIRRAAGDRVVTRRLAAAHDRFARAQLRTRANDYVTADSAYAAILADRPPSPALLEWAAYGHGNALIYDRAGRAEGERVIAALAARVDTTRYPALAARTLWALGVLRLRAGRIDAGLEAARRARDLFGRLGERENHSAMVGLEGETLRLAGDDAAGVAGLSRALYELRGYPTSVWRHNVLILLARAAADEGLELAAMAIEDEDVAAADAAGRPVSVVESRLHRARTLWAAGDRDRARAALAAVGRTIDALPQGDARAVFAAELRLEVASGPLRSEPARARALLDTVVAFFEPSRRPAKLIPAYVARAEASIALGRASDADADLERAAALYEAERVQMASLPQRAALLTQARSVFEALAMLRLREGRAADALGAIERGRSSFAAARPRGGGTTATAAGSRPARDEVVLDYALVGDTLLIWAVGDGRASALTRTTVDRTELAGTVERARAALELGAPEAALRPELGRLYDWLVRPVEQRLAGAGALVVVADGEIGDVPFAALWDARRGRYLVESRPTRSAATLGAALAPDDGETPSAASPEAALFVANPALDWRAYPSLAPLAGAEAEVRAVAPLYRRPSFLVGAAADSASVAQSLRGAELFHFAGHAVLEEWRPERSFLAVAPRGLTASAIATLDLHRLRLVVLSACETMRSPARRTGAFTSFTDAFLAAGARGVVGSLWRVEDTPTAALMLELHRAYRRAGDAPTALRDAQLALLHSPDAALRSPAAWGAFRYAGR